MAPIMTARPLGSVARYWPGTIRLEPDRPYVSWWSLLKALLTGSYSRTTIRPESEPTMI
jgi:hypothetical protein